MTGNPQVPARPGRLARIAAGATAGGRARSPRSRPPRSRPPHPGRRATVLGVTTVAVIALTLARIAQAGGTQVAFPAAAQIGPGVHHVAPSHAAATEPGSHDSNLTIVAPKRQVEVLSEGDGSTTTTTATSLPVAAVPTTSTPPSSDGTATTAPSDAPGTTTKAPTSTTQPSDGAGGGGDGKPAGGAGDNAVGGG